MVEGKNIYLDRGHIERMGFFTTRRVEAKSLHEAKKIAVELVKQELDEVTVLYNSPEDPPVFLIEKGQEIDSFDDCSVPGKGFSFYPDTRQVRRKNPVRRNP